MTFIIDFTRVGLFVHLNPCLFQGDTGFAGTKGPPGVPGEYVSKSDKLQHQEQQTKACHHRQYYHLIPLARAPKTLHGPVLSVGHCIAQGSSCDGNSCRPAVAPTCGTTRRGCSLFGLPQ